MAAIYMWRQSKRLVVTTTPYPLEDIAELASSATITSGSMDPIPEDELGMAVHFNTGAMYQTVWYYDATVPDDQTEVAVHFNTGAMYQTVWYYEETVPDDSAGMAVHFGDGSMENKAVFAYAPDEELAPTAEIYPAGCSMTSI